jgi:2-oxoglutarate dehydrogenase E1 component
MEQMYESWKSDPNSVHSSWKHYFENIESGAENPYVSPPNLGQSASAKGDINMNKII